MQRLEQQLATAQEHLNRGKEQEAHLREQLAAALAACKQKDEALKWLMDWQVKHVDVWDNPAFDNAEEVLTIQPDDSALKAWLEMSNTADCRSQSSLQGVVK